MKLINKHVFMANCIAEKGNKGINVSVVMKTTEGVSIYRQVNINELFTKKENSGQY